MIGNVVVEWRKMAGETDEIRKLNSLLTSAFIGVRDLPHDECLTHARVVMAHFTSDEADWEGAVRKYLRSMFAEGETLGGEHVRFPKYDAEVDESVTRIAALLKGGRWPDRLIEI